MHDSNDLGSVSTPRAGHSVEFSRAERRMYVTEVRGELARMLCAIFHVPSKQRYEVYVYSGVSERMERRMRVLLADLPAGLLDDWVWTHHPDWRSGEAWGIEWGVFMNVDERIASLESLLAEGADGPVHRVEPVRVLEGPEDQRFYA